MLDRDGPVPLYLQIAQVIHDRVVVQSLKPGDAVPSESAIQSEFGVARTTARRVARELRERGIAHTVQGHGTFVGAPGVPRARRKAPLYEKIAREIVEKIKQGELRPMRPIPSEKTLMQQYGVAKVTVRLAVAFLRDQGWVFTVPYRGTYVREGDRSG